MFNPFTLKEKTIIVTGASSGIGRQCAIDCSKMGAKIILIARNQERLEETLGSLDNNDHQVYSYDLTQIDGIKDLVNEIVSSNGKINGLIHAAGIEITKPIKLLEPCDFEMIYRTNNLSGFELMRQLSSIKSMNKGGSIIFISSITAIIGRSGVAAYAASKGAMISATKSFALELAKRQIRVNCISPGTILTPMMQNYINDLDEISRQKRVDGFPLGLGETTDISNACIYLLSDASRWITGQNIIIDGGYTIK